MTTQGDQCRSVLLVEDNRVQQTLMRIICERVGFSVTVASSGEEAIRAVQNRNGCYDIVLMDWKTAGMDGIDATVAIRTLEAGNGRRTPIVAVTAHAMVGDRERCLAAGMDDYLSKPFTALQLRAMLSRWTDYARRPALQPLPAYQSDRIGSKEL